MLSNGETTLLDLRKYHSPIRLYGQQVCPLNSDIPVFVLVRLTHFSLRYTNPLPFFYFFLCIFSLTMSYHDLSVCPFLSISLVFACVCNTSFLASQYSR